MTKEEIRKLYADQPHAVVRGELVVYSPIKTNSFKVKKTTRLNKRED